MVGMIYVCSERDRACGDNPRLYCETCPKRALPITEADLDRRLLFDVVVANTTFKAGVTVRTVLVSILRRIKFAGQPTTLPLTARIPHDIFRLADGVVAKSIGTSDVIFPEPADPTKPFDAIDEVDDER